jgi:hypothetical protein
MRTLGKVLDADAVVVNRILGLGAYRRWAPDPGDGG